MIHRRDLYRYGTVVLGNAFALALAIPGLRFLLDPLGKKGSAGEFIPLTRLDQLKVGVPESFPVLAERQDAWTQYPRQPVGSVWLVRQPEGSTPPVVALASECPHLSCPVTLAADKTGFLCPCHDSVFGLDGQRKNTVSPRGMDTLEVRLGDAPESQVLVKFARFRPQTKEKITLD